MAGSRNWFSHRARLNAHRAKARVWKSNCQFSQPVEDETSKRLRQSARAERAETHEAPGRAPLTDFSNRPSGGKYCMNPSELYSTLNSELEKIKEAKTFKYEVPLESETGGEVLVEGREVVMLASNNYLGLANHPSIKAAAHRAIDEWGYRLAPVRFLCGSEPIHFELERPIANFVG